MILLTTAYFPNIQYFSKFLFDDEIFIEANENYQKKSYRNRCEILSANGKLTLSIPVEKSKEKIKIKDVKISYAENWQKNHLKAIESAYGLSPYFEFYFDEIKHFFETKEKFLFDLNTKITETLLNITGISKTINLTKDFFPLENTEKDYRFSIHPRKNIQKPDTCFFEKKYIQTFSEKLDFVPNLSIIDLLFNLGPETKSYLKSVIKK